MGKRCSQRLSTQKLGSLLPRPTLAWTSHTEKVSRKVTPLHPLGKHVCADGSSWCTEHHTSVASSERTPICPVQLIPHLLAKMHQEKQKPSEYNWVSSAPGLSWHHVFHDARHLHL